MRNIQIMSRYLIFIFNVLLIILPILTVMNWLFVHLHTADVNIFINFFGQLERLIQTPEGTINASDVAWNPVSQSIGLFSDLIRLLPFILGLCLLKKIFKNYQYHEIFSIDNARHYRSLGLLFFLDAFVIKTLSNTLLILAVTLTNPPGHRYISVHFGTLNLTMLFYGMLILVISSVMIEASRLHDDQKLTI